jgi:hypothetical protein
MKTSRLPAFAVSLLQALKKSAAFLFVYFVYFVVSLSASTITGTIQNTSGNPYATNALFAPLSTPLASGNNIIASTPTNVVAAANGTYSVTLLQGNYLVTFGGLHRDSVLISVPNDANTYNLNSLITNGLTFNFPYSPIYEQRVNKGQADGYVGLLGTVLSPSGLTASNFSFQGSVNLGTAPDNYATVYVNQNSSLYVQPGAALTLAGDSSPRSEMFLHGTNAFIRFDEDAAINDSTAAKVWKFNRFNITSNNVAALGDATNIAADFLLPQCHVSTNNGSTDVYQILGAMNIQGLTTGTVLTNNNARAVPFYSGQGGSVDSLAVNVTTAVGASTVRFGIYNCVAPTNLMPGSLLVDCGVFDSSTIGPKVTNLVTKIRLQPGTVYWSLVEANAAVALKVFGSATGYPIMGMNTNWTMNNALEIVGVGYGALPSTCPLTSTIWQVNNLMCPVIAARFNAP